MKKTTLKPITRRLRALRGDRAMTQRDLADKVGIAYSRYMQIENGYREPTRGELGRIARALKTRPGVIRAASVLALDPIAAAS